MGIIGGKIGYSILKTISPRKHDTSEKFLSNKFHNTKLKEFFGHNIYDLVANKTVIDFGCGNGLQAVELAKFCPTANVIGIDIQDKCLEIGNQKALEMNVSNRCKFMKKTDELADIILSKDAFEHFSNPLYILETISSLLKPDGYLLASFGPTWYHPYGGHLFSIFPWSHLLFTENAQISWRSDFKSDGATKFSEVQGGLNQLSISKFEKIVRESPFKFDWIETVPIKGIKIFKYKLLREIGSSIIRCRLSLKQ